MTINQIYKKYNPSMDFKTWLVIMKERYNECIKAKATNMRFDDWAEEFMSKNGNYYFSVTGTQSSLVDDVSSASTSSVTKSDVPEKESFGSKLWGGFKDVFKTGASAIAEYSDPTLRGDDYANRTPDKPKSTLLGMPMAVGVTVVGIGVLVIGIGTYKLVKYLNK